MANTDGYILTAVEVLREAEQRFQGLMAEASSGGKYHEVMRLARAARDLRQLMGQVLSGDSDGQWGTLPQKPKAAPRARRKKALLRKRGRAREYPKFFRSGDQLLKTGWSKRKKKEYKHSAPRRLALPLARTIVEAGGSNGMVATDVFFPLHDPDDDSEVPSYQAYVVLAWLVETGVVMKHGRQGYTVPSGDSLSHQLEKRWDALAPATP